MRFQRSSSLIMLVAVMLCGVTLVSAQEKKQNPGAEMEAMMQEYQKLSLPGPEHHFLAQRVGKWDHVTKMWFDPKAEPNISNGTTEYRLIMDGRYLVQEVSGEFMGKPFHGMGIIGYDKFKKQYTNSWVDN